MIVFFNNAVSSQRIYQKIDMKIKKIEKYDSKGMWFELEIINKNPESICINSDVIGLGGGFSDDVFLVRRGGKEVNYKGVSGIKPGNYSTPMISLLSGQRITITFDLSGDYDFSMPGKYEILYDFPNRSNCGSKFFYSDFKSNLIKFDVN